MKNEALETHGKYITDTNLTQWGWITILVKIESAHAVTSVCSADDFGEGASLTDKVTKWHFGGNLSMHRKYRLQRE